MGLQKPSLGMISKDVLAMVCKESSIGPFICYALFMVLDHELIGNEKRYHVSTYITSYFPSSLINLGGNQVNILMLLCNFFMETFLEDDVRILVLE